MSAHAVHKRTSAPDIRTRKGGRPIVCLTAYDAPTAALLDERVDLLLVGDSLGMVVHGLPSTIGVTLDMMILHAKAVMRGSSRACVVVDLPFGTYEAAPEQAFASAARVLSETGAQGVKIESGPTAADTIAYLVARGIPVMGHVGLRPQSVNVIGGFKAQGRTEAERADVTATAKAADAAGAFAIVIEGVAESLASEITAAVGCPTIGIGASSACDGQILVTPDLLGLFARTPKFVRRYDDFAARTVAAVEAYADDVRERRFPGPEHVYRFGAETP